MEIVDLTAENVSQALCCVSYGGYHMRGVEERKRFLLWKLKDGKVRGKIAVEAGERLGWIDYYPRSDGWFRIGCIEVYKEYRSRGVGRELVNACLEDCRNSKGVIVAATVWDHMPKAFFKKFGFTDMDEKANISLMALKYKGDEPPANEKEKDSAPKLNLDAGKLVIDMFDDGECPTSYVTKQLFKEAAKDFADKIVIKEHDTKDRAVTVRFGDVEGIFLNGEKAFFGYPGELEGIKKILRKELEGKKLL